MFKMLCRTQRRDLIVSKLDRVHERERVVESEMVEGKRDN